MAGTRQDSNGAVMAPFGGLTVDEFPDLTAVSTLSLTAEDCKNTSSTVWSTSHVAPGRPCTPVTPSLKPTISSSNSQENCVAAVSLQSSTADRFRSTTSAWLTSVEPSGRPSTPVPPSATPAMMTSQTARKDFVPPPNIIADSSSNTTSLAWSTRPESSGRPSTPVPSAKSAIITSQVALEGAPIQTSARHGFTNTISSAWPTRFEPPDRPPTPAPPLTIPATTTPQIIGNAVPSMAAAVPYNDPRKIPNGVFVVCDDFLWKHRNRAASIYEKSKACKGCEIRLRLKYAVWSDNSKQWELIRPYPAESVKASVAFKECAQYSSNRPCIKTPCSFAHGPQELLMWTMEREGSKFDKETTRYFVVFY